MKTHSFSFSQIKKNICKLKNNVLNTKMLHYFILCHDQHSHMEDKENKPQNVIAKDCSESDVSQHIYRKLTGRKKYDSKKCKIKRYSPWEIQRLLFTWKQKLRNKGSSLRHSEFLQIIITFVAMLVMKLFLVEHHLQTINSLDWNVAALMSVHYLYSILFLTLNTKFEVLIFLNEKAQHFVLAAIYVMSAS